MLEGNLCAFSPFSLSKKFSIKQYPFSKKVYEYCWYPLELASNNSFPLGSITNHLSASLLYTIAFPSWKGKALS